MPNYSFSTDEVIDARIKVITANADSVVLSVYQTTSPRKPLLTVVLSRRAATTLSAQLHKLLSGRE